MSEKQLSKQTVSVQMPAELVEAMDRYGLTTRKCILRTLRENVKRTIM
ncbi:hypothetical protein AA0488_2801 [Kozakia baliensis NRIC 0488]|nr:hypothetical protein AA0488_2801 [Kozakia baliensis NRIC 0488]